MDAGDRLGRYDLVRELGVGGMATVYLARDRELRRDVAIKVLFAHLCKRPEVVSRFHREARAAAALDHPHILRVFDVGGGDSPDAGVRNPPFIVLELVQGRTLAAFADSCGPLLAEAAACIGAVMCSALECAHAAGIIHRDVKPANIMVDDDGRLTLTDFGVARLDDEDSVVTRTGALLGTPAFMSPEQAMGRPPDGRSDQYSLGATLYELATGHLPVSGPTHRVVATIAKGDVPPAVRRRSAVGCELSEVLGKMMARAPEHRYGNASEARQALLNLLPPSFGQPQHELNGLFADPAGWRSDAVDQVIRHSLEVAQRSASHGAIPKALALTDRILTLRPDCPEAHELLAGLGQATRRPRWPFALALAAVLGAILVWWLIVDPSAGRSNEVAVAEVADRVDAAPVAPPSDAQGLAQALDASPSVVVDAVARRPDAGARTRSRATGARRRVPRTRPTSSEPDAAAVTAAFPDASAPSPPKPATLVITMSAWCDLSVGSRRHGRYRVGTQMRIQVAAGQHNVVCSQGMGLGTWRGRVTVRAGETVNINGDVHSKVEVIVSVSDGRYIRLAGRRHANRSRFRHAAGRVRVELYAGSNKVTHGYLVLRGQRCVLRDRPTLGCYR